MADFKRLKSLIWKITLKEYPEQDVKAIFEELAEAMKAVLDAKREHFRPRAAIECIWLFECFGMLDYMHHDQMVGALEKAREMFNNDDSPTYQSLVNKAVTQRC